jgi:hypothetical protein
MFMYLLITMLCKFLHGCVMLCVASLVVCGFTGLFGPGFTPGTDYVVCLLSRLGIRQISVPLHY